MSGKRFPEEAALDRRVRELRAEPTPELDWDRVEARLLSEPRPEPLSVTQRFSSRLRVPAMGLLAASVVALVVLHRAPTATQLRPVAQMASGPLNGDKLALGTRVTALDRGFRVLVRRARGPRALDTGAARDRVRLRRG